MCVVIDPPTCYGMLKSLADNPDFSRRDLTKRLGISLGKVNFCLNALIEKGWLKVGNFRSSTNKRAYAYLLTPQGVEQKGRLTIEFLQIKVREYESLRAEMAELKRETEQGEFRWEQL